MAAGHLFTLTALVAVALNEAIICFWPVREWDGAFSVGHSKLPWANSIIFAHCGGQRCQTLFSRCRRDRINANRQHKPSGCAVNLENIIWLAEQRAFCLFICMSHSPQKDGTFPKWLQPDSAIDFLVSLLLSSLVVASLFHLRPRLSAPSVAV